MKTLATLFLLLFVLSTGKGQDTTRTCEQLVYFAKGGRGGYAFKPTKLTGVDVRTINVRLSYLLITLSLTDETKCFDTGQPVIFVMADGTRVQLPNDNEVACSTEGHLNLGGQHKHSEELQQLKAKMIHSIQIPTKSGPMNVDLNEAEQSRMHTVLNCLGGQL